MNDSILIVEDEPKLAKLLSNYLRQAGYEPECLENGLDVLPRVRERMPALILLDLNAAGAGRRGYLQGDSHVFNGAHHHGHRPHRGDRPASRP